MGREGRGTEKGNRKQKQEKGIEEKGREAKERDVGKVERQERGKKSSQVKPALILVLTDVCSTQFVVAKIISSILLTGVQDTWTLPQL